MRTAVLILVGVAFAGAVGTRSISDPALGGGAGTFHGPGVTTCTIGDTNC